MHSIALKRSGWECVLNSNDVNYAYLLFLNTFKEKLDKVKQITMINLELKVNVSRGQGQF